MESLEIKKINEKINEIRDVASDLLDIFSTLLIDYKGLALEKEFIGDVTITIHNILNGDDIEESINYFVYYICANQDITCSDLRATLSSLELYQSTINYFEKIIGKWDD